MTYSVSLENELHVTLFYFSEKKKNPPVTLFTPLLYILREPPWRFVTEIVLRHYI